MQIGVRRRLLHRHADFIPTLLLVLSGGKRVIPEVILTALFLGWALKGRFGRLADVRIKYWWMIFVPLGLMIASLAVNYSHAVPFSSPLFSIVRVAELATVAVFTIANWSIPGAKLVLAGLVVNLVVVIANGGMMPVDYDCLVAITGRERLKDWIAVFPFVNDMLIRSGTRLAFLCDVIPARWPFVLVPSVYSIGDVITSIGGFIAIIAIMRTPLPAEHRGVSR